MEDISRELEREIAQSKPKPYKQDRKTRVLIIDDFGQMKSGEYLKTLIRLLTGLCLVLFVSVIVLYLLYSGNSENTGQSSARLARAEKKVAELTHEKEVLMARLVIQGKEPGIDKPEPAVPSPVGETPLLKKAIAKKNHVLKSVQPKSADQKPQPEALTVKETIASAGMVKTQSATNFPEKDQINDLTQKQATPEIKPSQTKPSAQQLPVKSPELNKTVAIEKFTVTKDGNNGDLLVRFDIRNMSTQPGDVSGRIFTVLKPDNGTQSQWLVVPSSRLENGIPLEYKKGQYFSISHFKPVKFRIKNSSKPDFYKKAAIYIYNAKGEVIVEKLIKITEADLG